MMLRVIVTASTLLVAGAVDGATNTESFYLKSAKTERMYGPYTYAHGAALEIGGATFEIIRKNAVDPVAIREPAEAATPEPPAPARDPQLEAAAMAALTPWLELIDADNFGKAWEEAASYLKQSVNREEFIRSLETVRGTLGHVVARTLNSIQIADSLPSAPDGQYVIMQFDTVLEGKQGGAETIIPMLDMDGAWRISGYYCR